MNNILESKDVFSKKAFSMKSRMKELGHDISVGHCYEALAAISGYRNWATMSSMLPSSPDEEDNDVLQLGYAPPASSKLSVTPQRGDPVSVPLRDLRNHLVVIGDRATHARTIVERVARGMLERNSGLLVVDRTGSNDTLLSITALAVGAKRYGDLKIIDLNTRDKRVAGALSYDLVSGKTADEFISLCVGVVKGLKVTSRSHALYVDLVRLLVDHSLAGKSWAEFNLFRFCESVYHFCDLPDDDAFYAGWDGHVDSLKLPHPSSKARDAMRIALVGLQRVCGLLVAMQWSAAPEKACGLSGLFDKRDIVMIRLPSEDKPGGVQTRPFEHEDAVTAIMLDLMSASKATSSGELVMCVWNDLEERQAFPDGFLKMSEERSVAHTFVFDRFRLDHQLRHATTAYVASKTSSIGKVCMSGSTVEIDLDSRYL